MATFTFRRLKKVNGLVKARYMQMEDMEKENKDLVDQEGES